VAAVQFLSWPYTILPYNPLRTKIREEQYLMVHYHVSPTDHKRLRQQYRVLYQELLQVLDAYDLAGIGEGRPADEYALEVSTILPRLKEASSAEDVTRILTEEFLKFFGPTPLGTISRFETAGAKVWEAWQRYPQDNAALGGRRRGRWSKNSVHLPEGFPEELFQASIPVSGIQRLAWRADEAIKVVEFLTSRGFAVSGEVYHLRGSEASRSALPSWWFPPRRDIYAWQTTYSRDERGSLIKHQRYGPKTTWQQYVCDSKRQSIEYIENFRARNGEEYCYVLTWISEADEKRQTREREKTIDHVVEGSLIESLRARIWLRKHERD
jgi:hypothetical protein